VTQHLAPVRSLWHWAPMTAPLDASLKSPKWFRLLPRRLGVQRLAPVQPTMCLLAVKWIHSELTTWSRPLAPRRGTWWLAWQQSFRGMRKMDYPDRLDSMTTQGRQPRVLVWESVSHTPRARKTYRYRPSSTITQNRRSAVLVWELESQGRMRTEPFCQGQPLVASADQAVACTSTCAEWPDPIGNTSVSLRGQENSAQLDNLRRVRWRPAKRPPQSTCAAKQLANSNRTASGLALS